MKEVGLGILCQAQLNSLFGFFENRLDSGIFAVLQCAHAAEILAKACIANEHPLLIFSNLPTELNAKGDLLQLDDLFEHGKTIQFHDIPRVLWASTGYKIANLAEYSKFGKLRNCIQHFHTPETDFTQECASFIYQIINPLIYHFFRIHAIEFCDGSFTLEQRLVVLLSRGINFTYPETMIPDVENAKRICTELYSAND